MKGVIYFLVLLFITAIVVGVVKLEFDAKLFSKANLYQWLTIGASVCGLLLSFIFLRYEVLNQKLGQKN